MGLKRLSVNVPNYATDQADQAGQGQIFFGNCMHLAQSSAAASASIQAQTAFTAGTERAPGRLSR